MKFARWLAVVPMLAGILAGSLTASPAHAATATPTAKTCAAFRTWVHHRTLANLNAVLTASETAPWKYLGEDIIVLYTDARDNRAAYIPGDANYVATDCKGK